SCGFRRASMGEPLRPTGRGAAAVDAARSRDAPVGHAVPLRPSRPAHASRGRASPDPDRSPLPWSGYFVEPAGAVLPLEPPAEPFPVFRGDLCGIAPEAQPDPTRHARGSRAPDPVRGTNGRVSP